MKRGYISGLLPDSPGNTGNEFPGQIAGRPLDEWNAAYTRVESYFYALRVRNKLLLGRLVIHVLKRVMQRTPHDSKRHVSEIAAEELDHLVTEWFAQVLQKPPEGVDLMLSTRGRLALLLADMPGKWQDQFLRPGPWPEEFVQSMRDAYLRAGPDFQFSKMAPRPFDLGPLTKLANLSRLAYGKMVLIWILLVMIMIIIFKITH